MAPLKINKILIANRGEIARRIARTCREMGIATVGVCSEPDRDAPFAREVDEVVPLAGARPAESYLQIETIVEAARKTHCDAVHPGYGFLSENPAFARACDAAGLIFIGPPAEVIEAMGSKLAAKRRMQAIGVPVLPTIELAQHAPEQVLRHVQAESLKWPLLVKASAGGGGRGMRVVRHADELAGAIRTARQEAQAAFGDGTLFVEPYIESARHIEVQILGDAHGSVAHLFERECSIQRRHQKIIEECPSPTLDEEARRAIVDAALRVAKAIGYVNAGTVEFLLTPDGQFYFLEVNTRLQVEHPVTECVTGLDLVRQQILIAEGQPLGAEVREAVVRGHAIEARLYAEDPARDYLPSAGHLHCFRFTDRTVRVDSAIEERAKVSPYYDSMLAKVIAHAPTRGEAVRRLRNALAGARIHGLRTNRELLVHVLEHAEFLSGEFDTHFLVRHDPAELAAPLGGQRVEQLHAAAAALSAQAARRRQAKVLRNVPSGWRNNPSQFQRANFTATHGEIVVEYRFGRAGIELRIDGTLQAGVSAQAVSAQVVSRHEIRMNFDGVERTFAVHRHGDTYYVDSPLGASALVEAPRFPLPPEDVAPGSLVAPLPGVVSEVKVKKGDTVSAGDVLVVMDSMKVFHSIAAPWSGRIAEIRVSEGNHVDRGTLLAVIEAL